MCKRDLRGCLAAESVGNRASDHFARPRRAFAGGQGVMGIGSELGLDREYVTFWTQRLECEGYARREAPEADRHKNYRSVADSHFGQLLDNLQADRALSRDDAIVIGRRDELQSLGIGDLVSPLDTLFVCWPHKHDLRAVSPNTVDLDLWRVVWHYHDTSSAGDICRERNCLRVIAARVRHDSDLFLILGQLGNGVGRAADLELARWLQVLWLDEAHVAEAQQGST